MLGAGTAGIGIADALRQVMIDDGLPPAEAARRFYALDRNGLLTSDYAGTLRDSRCAPTLRLTRWRALSTVFVSHPSRSATASYEWPSR